MQRIQSPTGATVSYETHGRGLALVTDALAAVIPDVRIQELPGEAHEGMTTAPEMYAEAVGRFLLAS